MYFEQSKQKNQKNMSSHLMQMENRPGFSISTRTCGCPKKKELGPQSVQRIMSFEKANQITESLRTEICYKATNIEGTIDNGDAVKYNVQFAKRAPRFKYA